LIPNYALAEQVSFNDPDITATYQEFDSPDGHGRGRGYLVVPANIEKSAPAVLVVHENRGLNPYIKDVARRFAKLGFVAFAPDALFSLGGYPGNDDEGRAMQKSLDREKIEMPKVIDAAVPFYGTPAKEEYVGQVKAPLLLQFAENDKRVNASWPAYEALLKSNEVDYTAHVYAGTNHGFHNDSTSRYDPEAAELSWRRTVEFFNKHLS